MRRVRRVMPAPEIGEISTSVIAPTDFQFPAATRGSEASLTESSDTESIHLRTSGQGGKGASLQHTHSVAFGEGALLWRVLPDQAAELAMQLLQERGLASALSASQDSVHAVATLCQGLRR